MSQTYLERVVGDQIVAIQQQASSSDRGSYLITDEVLMDTSFDNLAIFTWIMENLMNVYPDYIWTRTEQVEPRGIRFSWKRRKNAQTPPEV